MGGIRTNYRGESVGLTGLFAVGEAACWDMHGFNRLGGNSVAETVVAGMIVGEFIADFCESDRGKSSFSSALVSAAWRDQEKLLQRLTQNPRGENPYQLIREMQNIMTDKVAIFRDGEALEQAVIELRLLLVRSARVGLGRSFMGANPALVAAYRLPRMLKLALSVAQGALARTESRGAHFRKDYPRRNDQDWLCRTLAYWPDAQSTGVQLSYEQLAVSQMEVPPGWRGYGARDYIDSSDTGARQQEIDSILAAMPEADRYARQEALMPYRDLLPEKYRARNSRPGDSYE